MLFEQYEDVTVGEDKCILSQVREGVRSSNEGCKVEISETVELLTFIYTLHRPQVTVGVNSSDTIRPAKP